jgi:flagella basal body P-ring formation protein FlgA
MKFLLPLFFAALVLLGANTARAAVVLELKAQQIMTTGSITLNDLLQSSQGLSEDDLALVLAASPALGRSETWTRDQIASVLPDSIKQQMPQWEGATSVAISRPSAKYSEAETRQLIGSELARQLPSDCKFEVLEFAGFQPFLIPQGAVDARVELGTGTLRNEWGEASIQFRQDGQLAVTQNVRFHWACTRQVWRTLNRVPAGQPLVETDFEQVDQNVLKIPGMMEPAATFPDTKVTAHILMQGKILMENDWVEPTLVNRNDLVTILYDRNGLSITLQAKALASGVKNQVIEVQNTSSHKVFNARIVDQRTLVYAD